MGDFPDSSSSSRNKFVSSGERLKEERLRLAVAQIDMAEKCDVSRKTLLAWEKGEQTPNGAAFSVMDALGVDVLYVITGRRAGATEVTLAPAERDLLTAWRNADQRVQSALTAVAAITKAD